MSQKMFGEVAFEMGFVTTDQLYRALTMQAKAEVEKRPPRMLGDLLVELGFMTEMQVLDVLKVLHGPKAKSIRMKKKPAKP